jgi:glutamine synthetase
MTSLRADGVDVVIGSVIDLGGVARAKTAPLRRLKAFATAGMGASPTWNVFCIDDEIAFTEHLGVAGDLRLLMDSQQIRIVEPGVAWAPAVFADQDGETSPYDTRSLLRRTTEQLAEEGYATLVGCELEFGLFSATDDPDEDVPDEDGWIGYGLGAVLEDDHREFVRDLVRRAEAARLPLEQVHAEYGRRQFEVSLAPTDPVSAADNVVLARLLIGRAAQAHGLRPSFAPVADVHANAANGAHQHVSFTRAGVPLLSGGDGPHGLRREGESALAGILRRLPEFLGFHAGSVLSPYRLLPDHWSGAHLCWGLENREAAVRFVGATNGNPHGASIELKSVDGSANPYLSIAATLWSAREGLADGLRAPLPVDGNPAEAQDIATLPSSQNAILAALEGSASANAFAGVALEALLAVRRHEAEAYADATLPELVRRFRYAWSI